MSSLAMLKEAAVKAATKKTRVRASNGEKKKAVYKPIENVNRVTISLNKSRKTGEIKNIKVKIYDEVLAANLVGNYANLIKSGDKLALVGFSKEEMATMVKSAGKEPIINKGVTRQVKVLKGVNAGKLMTVNMERANYLGNIGTPVSQSKDCAVFSIKVMVHTKNGLSVAKSAKTILEYLGKNEKVMQKLEKSGVVNGKMEATIEGLYAYKTDKKGANGLYEKATLPVSLIPVTFKGEGQKIETTEVTA